MREGDRYCPNCGKEIVQQVHLSTQPVTTKEGKTKAEQRTPRLRPLSVLPAILVFLAIIWAACEFVPNLRADILSIPFGLGLGDKLALNPAAESYLNQTWEGQVINLPAEGTFELTFKNASGQDSYEAYPDGTPANITNYQNVHNPTMDELKAFLKADQTEEHVYSDSYVCMNFAVTLHNNAEAQGIRCAYVSIEGTSPHGHALNAFQTTDEGLVFVDDTGDIMGTGIDKLDKITMGQEGNWVPFFRSDADFQIIESGGISEVGQITSGEMWW